MNERRFDCCEGKSEILESYEQDWFSFSMILSKKD